MVFFLAVLLCMDAHSPHAKRMSFVISAECMVKKRGGALTGFSDMLEGVVLQSIGMSYDHCITLMRTPLSKAASQSCVTFWQRLVDAFVGYQVSLDLAYVSTSGFNPSLVVVGGPGAVCEIKHMFPHCPTPSSRMDGSNAMRDVCVPFYHRVLSVAE